MSSGSGCAIRADARSNRPAASAMPDVALLSELIMEGASTGSAIVIGGLPRPTFVSGFFVAEVLWAVASVLFPLPDHDFDVTEVAVPWKLLTEAGHRVVFASEAGAPPACDPLLLTGVVFGKLGARAEPIAFYRELEQAPERTSPMTWASCRAADFDALFLAGGHAPG